MAKWTLPMEGGCRCGRIRFPLGKAPLLTMACHCTGCQRMSASAFSTTVMLPTDGFELIRAGALDDPSWFTPFVETYTSEALPWPRTGARHSYPHFPAMEEYVPLIADFSTAHE